MSNSDADTPPQAAAPLPSWVGYAVAIAAVVVATLVRLALDPALGDNYPFVTYFVAVAVVAWFGRTATAVFTLVASWVVTFYLFVPPRYTFAPTDPNVVLGMGLFLIVAAVIVAMSHAMRRAASAAAEERERLRTTLASIGDAVISTDRDGNVTYLNAVAESLTGWTNGEAVGVPLTRVFQIVNEDTRGPINDPAAKALQEGVVVGLAKNTVLISRDGTERPIDDSDAPIRDKSGEIRGTVLVFRDISDRKKAEAEQREARQQITTTLESVTDGFMRYDREWRIVYVNAEAERINRLTRSQMLSRIVWEVFPALVGTKFEAEFRRAVAERVTIEFENYYEPFGRWYSLKGYPTADGGLTTYIRDITDKKLAEEDLRQSLTRERLRADELDTVLAVVPAVIWIAHDPAGQRISGNRAANELLRVAPDINQSLSAPPPERPIGFRVMKDGVELRPEELPVQLAASGTEVWGFEEQVVFDDGTQAHLFGHAIPLRDGDGRVRGSVAAFIDITERKQAEQEIVRVAAESERQKRLYETVLTNTPDFVYVFSLDHKVVYANDALLKMWGRERDDVIGKTFLEIGYEPWHAEMHDREIDQVRATKKPIRGDVPFNGTNGRRQYDYIFVPVVGADGEVEAVAGTTRDVTERNETEARLRASEERQAYLVKLGDTLRPLSDATDVQAEASQLLGEHLRANRVVYFEIRGDDYVIEQDYSAGVGSLVGRYPVAAFGPAILNVLLEGRTIIESDATTEPGRPADERAAFAAIQVRGHVDVPLVKDGRFVAGMTVQVSDARHWTRQEISLIEDTAERTWAAVERVRAQSALRQSEERLRQALNAARMVAWEYDPATGAVVTSDNATDMYGLSPSEGMGTIDQALAILHPNDVDRHRATVAAAVAAGEGFHSQFRIVRPDNTAVQWMEEWGHVVRDAAGKAVRLVGVNMDITARKRAEDAVRESEERFRLMADAAPVLIWLSGTDKLFYWYNRPWLEFTGRSMEEEVGQGATEVVHPDDLGRILPLYVEAFEARAPFSLEYRLRRHDGEFRWMTCNGVPRYRADGEFDGYIGSCLDVTDYKNAQEKLRDADRRKDEFLATLSHEMRTPLSAIIGWISILRQEGCDAEDLKEGLAAIDRNSKAQVKLIEDVLDVSRIVNGKLRLEMRPCEMVDVIRAGLDTVRASANARGITLQTRLDPAASKISCDDARMQQVVWNLVSNAVKFTPNGGTVTVTLERECSNIKIQVKDNGQGMGADLLPYVFERFRQADSSSKRKFGGLGLGLSIVKYIVEAHGGTVGAESEGEGKGSTFTVLLPIRAVRLEEDSMATPTSSLGTGAETRKAESTDSSSLVHLDGVRVLLVDDEADARQLLKRVLEQAGAKVFLASSAREALDVLSKLTPEVLISDLAMPDEDGLDLIRQVRGRGLHPCELPAVALTAFASKEDQQAALSAGFQVHVSKPADPHDLTAVIARLTAKTS